MAQQSATGPDTPRTAPADAPSPVRVIGDFQLMRLLGRGGMAEVWLAEQTSLKRYVALKLLKPELMCDDNYVKRFQSEAKAAAGLSHPNIVHVFAIGQVDDVHYISQEYVQGATLKSFLKKKGALDAQTALHIMRQVASALQAASDRGIVHRDIKPENIMLNRKGDVKVTDFGLAQLMGGERLNLTQEGTTMGTPLYMSPEQVNGDKLDPRSDIYSFGVTCYHMLAGETPFRGETAIAVAMQHVNAATPDLQRRRGDLPPELCEIVRKMLEKSPKDRYQSATRILADLKKVMRTMRDNGQLDSVELPVFDAAETPPSVAVRRPWLVLSLLGALAGGASAGIGWWQRPPLPASQGSPVADEGSAKAQFRSALMQVDNEDAFRSVKRYYPHDTLWTAMADEQLMLLYLKDVTNEGRHNAIVAQIESLRSHSQTAHRYALEAAIAQAYLELHQGKRDLANATLEAARIPVSLPIPNSILGTWQIYLSEIRREIMRGGRNGPPSPPGDDARGPRPSGRYPEGPRGEPAPDQQPADRVST